MSLWCPSGKNVYTSPEMARRALYTARLNHQKARTIEKRTYKCSWCGYWHLTHQNPPCPRRKAKR